MKLVLLGGNSVKNKEWLENVRDKLKDLFEECAVQYYNHWKSGGDVDWKEEVERLGENSNKNCVIFAKSAGIGVSLKAIYEGKVKPIKCIFVGTPLDWAEKHGNELSPYFINYKTSTLFIQQTNDPYASSAELKKFLEKNKLKNYELKEIKGKDHNYNNLDEIRKLVEIFLSASNK